MIYYQVYGRREGYYLDYGERGGSPMIYYQIYGRREGYNLFFGERGGSYWYLEVGKATTWTMREGKATTLFMGGGKALPGLWRKGRLYLVYGGRGGY